MHLGVESGVVKASGLKENNKKTPKQLKEQYQGLLVSSAEFEERKLLFFCAQCFAYMKRLQQLRDTYF